ncbi:MAG: hypothetical protein Q9227_001897 [Pyrenula ochraceoflavens]
MNRVERTKILLKWPVNRCLNSSVNQDKSPRSSIEVVFVSIGFEYACRRVSTCAVTGKLGLPYRVSQLGIATLDTRNLQEPDTVESLEDADPISTAGYYTGHWSKAARSSRFGNCTRVRQAYVSDVVKKALSIIDPKSGQYRNVILVGYNLASETTVLKSLNVRCMAFPRLLGTLDTVHLCREVTGRKETLFSMLRRLSLDVPEDSIHNGGNDAYYTPRVLLMLTSEMEQGQGKDQGALKALDAVARSQIPEQKVLGALKAFNTVVRSKRCHKEKAWNWQDDEVDAPLLGASFPA